MAVEAVNHAAPGRNGHHPAANSRVGTYHPIVPSLLPYSSPVSHRATAKRGVLGLPMLLARRVFKVFLRPWLEFQTLFNHAVIRTLDHNQQQVVLDLTRVGEEMEFVRREVGGLIQEVQAFAGLPEELRGRFTDLQSRLARQEEALRELATSQLHGQRIQDSRLNEKFESLQLQITRQFEEAERKTAQVLHEAEVHWRQLLNERLAEVERQSRGPSEAAINRELGPTGKLAEAGLFFPAPVRVKLSEGAPTAPTVTERILEQIWIHSRLPAPPANVLDMGCAESYLAIEMASMGFQVTGVDLHPLPLSHPNFRMVKADLAQLPFPDGFFDVAVCRSTLEHVGLKWYGEPSPATTDQRALEEAFRVMRPGGRLLLTAPYGTGGETPVHRIYTRQRLAELTQRFRVVEMRYGLREGEHWFLSDDTDRAERADSLGRVSAVVLCVLEKP